MSKAEKEAFVTGHSGTTISEILLVCISAPIGIFLFHELRNCHEKCYKQSLSFHMAVILESLTILLPMTLCQTILLHPFGVGVLVLMLTVALMLHLSRRANISKTNAIDDASKKEITGSRSANLDFLTFYRSTVSYLTFVAILAVDFPIFPRSFAKTEVNGYSLMDVGAASFCISGGLVSWFARRNSNGGAEAGAGDNIHPSESKRFKKVAWRCIPLLIMGFIRLLTTKGLEYQEHVSEYGVHWNFFFTLTIVGLTSTFIRAVLRIKNPIWWIGLLCCYQFMLTRGGLQEYIEDAPRHCGDEHEGKGNNLFLFGLGPVCHLFAANREGLLGSIGYLIFHLASEDIAHYCLWSCSSKGKDQNQNQGSRLVIVTVVSWTVHLISVSVLGIQASRRSTNMSFVAWAIAHNMTILSLSWLAFKLGNLNSSNLSTGAMANIHMKDRHDDVDVDVEMNPPIFAAVNRHGLLVFILANLMTGAVNLSIDTLHASNLEAIVVIFLYLCAVGVVALLLDWKHRHRTDEKAKIKIKIS